VQDAHQPHPHHQPSACRRADFYLAVATATFLFEGSACYEVVISGIICIIPGMSHGVAGVDSVLVDAGVGVYANEIVAVISSSKIDDSEMPPEGMVGKDVTWARVTMPFWFV